MLAELIAWFYVISWKPLGVPNRTLRPGRMVATRGQEGVFAVNYQSGRNPTLEVSALRTGLSQTFVPPLYGRDSAAQPDEQIHTQSGFEPRQN